MEKKIETQCLYYCLKLKARAAFNKRTSDNVNIFNLRWLKWNLDSLEYFLIQVHVLQVLVLGKFTCSNKAQSLAKLIRCFSGNANLLYI